jgi:hypothetical protein
VAINIRCQTLEEEKAQEAVELGVELEPRPAQA